MAEAGNILDPDRTLALTYVPASRRPAVAALWRLDAALGAVLAGGREPLISQIKLVWWRDALSGLDHARAPAEPVLQDVARHVLPLGLSGADLSEMEAGWEILLAPDRLSAADFGSYATARGGLLFRYSAIALGQALEPSGERAGEAWALVDLARHSNAEDAEAALAAASERLAEGSRARWPSRLRALGMLGALAARDVGRPGALEPQGAPGRMLRMLRHRFTGR